MKISAFQHPVDPFKENVSRRLSVTENVGFLASRGAPQVFLQLPLEEDIRKFIGSDIGGIKKKITSLYLFKNPLVIRIIRRNIMCRKYYYHIQLESCQQMALRLQDIGHRIVRSSFSSDERSLSIDDKHAYSVGKSLGVNQEFCNLCWKSNLEFDTQVYLIIF